MLPHCFAHQNRQSSERRTRALVQANKSDCHPTSSYLTLSNGPHITYELIVFGKVLVGNMVHIFFGESQVFDPGVHVKLATVD